MISRCSSILRRRSGLPARHHPFTSPKAEDIPLFGTNPGAMHANAYDLVINGVEQGGGSIRIHRRDVQEKMFTALGFSREEYEAKFGFLLGAFRYGARRTAASRSVLTAS